MAALVLFAAMVGSFYSVFWDTVDLITKFLATILDFASVFIRGIHFAHGLANGTKMNQFITLIVQGFHEKNMTAR